MNPFTTAHAKHNRHMYKYKQFYQIQYFDIRTEALLPLEELLELDGV